jgi:hypothetical protein
LWRESRIAGVTTIAGEINGDGRADFYIELAGIISLIPWIDFVL